MRFTKFFFCCGFFSLRHLPFFALGKHSSLNLNLFYKSEGSSCRTPFSMGKQTVIDLCVCIKYIGFGIYFFENMNNKIRIPHEKCIVLIV